MSARNILSGLIFTSGSKIQWYKGSYTAAWNQSENGKFFIIDWDNEGRIRILYPECYFLGFNEISCVDLDDGATVMLCAGKEYLSFRTGALTRSGKEYLYKTLCKACKANGTQDVPYSTDKFKNKFFNNEVEE